MLLLRTIFMSMALCGFVACSGAKEVCSVNDNNTIKHNEISVVDEIVGSWQLASYDELSQEDEQYSITIKHGTISIYRAGSLVDSFTWIMTAMSHESMQSLLLKNNSIDNYPWLQSGFYGIREGSLVIINPAGTQTRFARKDDHELVLKPSVSKYKNSRIEELPSYFFDQVWYHSYEEDRGGKEYFRPATEPYDPFPSLWQNQFVFQSDNTCKYRYLSPVDAHEMRDANWAYFPNKIFLLENDVNIIDVYMVHNLEDTLLVLTKERPPIDKVYGRWNLVETNLEDVYAMDYRINIRGQEVDIYMAEELLQTAVMSHSAWRLQEPLAFTFGNDISMTYPWLNSGHYGVINDTLVIEIDGIRTSKFIR